MKVNLNQVKVGDTITRMVAGTMPMDLKVSEVTEDRIVCGPWAFSRQTGLELDEDLGWDAFHSGSFIDHDGIKPA